MTVRRQSAADLVRSSVAHGPTGRFWRPRDFDASTRAVETELGRMVTAGELVRVRKGLYWRGETTKFGMLRPSPLSVAVAVGGDGSGPSGISAARSLGVTTQVPGTIEVAVPGRAPKPWTGVTFKSRPYERRLRKMEPLEVAVLELLRDPSAAEAPWSDIADKITTLIETSKIRADVLADEVADEPSIAARRRWKEMATAP